MKKLGWGVLSNARIGVTKVIPAIAAAESSRLVAISSRSLDAAQKAADQLGFERAYHNYAAPSVDGFFWQLWASEYGVALQPGVGRPCNP